MNEIKYDLNYYQKMISDIYKDRNIANEQIIPLEVSSLISLSTISKSNNESDFITNIAWIFSLANKYNIKIQESVVKKFPNVCHYCLTAPCNCSKTKRRPLENIYMTETQKMEKRKYYYDISYDPNKTYDFMYFTKLIEHIYPNNRFDYELHGEYLHISKIFEESGELLNEINRSHKGLVSFIDVEFADLFIWVLSLWSSKFPDSNYDKEFQDYYFRGCPKCTCIPCKCNNIEVHRGYLSDDVLNKYYTAIARTSFKEENLRHEANDLCDELGVALDENSNHDIKEIILAKAITFCNNNNIQVDSPINYRY